MAQRSNDKWSVEEDRRLKAMRAAGKSSVSIAAALKRTVGGVRGRLGVLKRAERAKDEPQVPEFPDSSH